MAERNIFHNDSGLVPASGQGMRIFIFKSDASPDLRAFGGYLAGSRLPSQFRPWHAIGAVAPDREPPHNLSRSAIEAAINDCGFQLWRMTKKTADGG
jgi:hypothetical protein